MVETLVAGDSALCLVGDLGTGFPNVPNVKNRALSPAVFLEHQLSSFS